MPRIFIYLSPDGVNSTCYNKSVAFYFIIFMRKKKSNGREITVTEYLVVLCNVLLLREWNISKCNLYNFNQIKNFIGILSYIYILLEFTILYQRSMYMINHPVLLMHSIYMVVHFLCRFCSHTCGTAVWLFFSVIYK